MAIKKSRWNKPPMIEKKAVPTPKYKKVVKKEIVVEPAPEITPAEPEGEMSDAEKLETLWAWYQEVKGG